MDATVKRMENFKEMKSMGYSEKEIYQDYADRFLHSDQHSPIDKEAQIKKVKMSLKKTF